MEPQKIIDNLFEDITEKQLLQIEKNLNSSKAVWDDTPLLKVEQDLKKVILMDITYLKSINITSRQIKDRIKKLINKAKDEDKDEEGYFETTREEETIYKIYKVAWKMLGGIGCPFNIEYWNGMEDVESSICSKTDWYDITIIKYNINDPNNKEKIRLPVTLLHLIRAHSFYGGPGTKHRLEPSYLVSFLNLRVKL